MENNNSTKRIHPLVAGAAISVILVSLTGVAAITGLLPNSHSTNAPAAAAAPEAAAPTTANALAAVSTTAKTPAAESQPETAAAEPKPAPARHHNYAPPHSTKTAHASPPTYAASEPVAQAPAICASCGRVEAVQALQQEAKPSGVGVVAGAVLGGVLGNQVGGGNGRTLATVAGAVGGGYAGNQIEKHARATTSYQVRVRMEDGTVRSFPYTQQPGWNVGDRVRVVDGHLAARA